MSMDVLKKLFEQHFHAPPDHSWRSRAISAVSGRKIIRLSNEKTSAIGILYGVREENAASWNSPNIFGATAFPFRKFTPKL